MPAELCDQQNTILIFEAGRKPNQDKKKPPAKQAVNGHKQPK